MSGKSKKSNTGRLNRKQLAAVLAGLALVFLVVILLLTRSPAGSASTGPADTAGASASVSGPTADAASEPTRVPVQMDALEEVGIDLGLGMLLTDVGKYTGVYMEDGTDEIVSGIMMIAVKNVGEETIQYAEITMPVGDQTASFSLTTLPPGSTVILLEQNRMAYTPGEYTTAAAKNVALFSAPLSLCEDRLKIQILDGAINVSNISGKDISGDIVIYYKNSAEDVFYGGITYRVRLEGGLQADEVRQIMASHFSASGSTIMFVTCGEA